MQIATGYQVIARSMRACRRKPPFLILTVALLLAPAAEARGASDIDAGEVLQIRLTSRVCTATSRVGDPVTAVVLGRMNTTVDDNLAGGQLSGVVLESQGVGVGIRHPRAKLRLQFDTLQVLQAIPVSISTRVIGVENARETVDASGLIHGIEAADSLSSLINNRWIHVPSFTSFSVYTNLGVIAYKLATPFFPDPEIHYQPGTELSLIVRKSIMVPERPPTRVNFSDERSEDLEQAVRGLPVRTLAADGKRSADIVNVLLVGPEKSLIQAFRMSGWVTGKRLTFKVAFHELAAIFEKRYYDMAPISQQSLDGEPSAMSWQKGLNDQTKRHHARIWKLEENYQGSEMWAMSATRDVAVGMRMKSFELYHHIETNIDLERTKIVRDLVQTGCAVSVRSVERPWVPRMTLNSTNDEMITDGRIAVVALGPCRAEAALVPMVIPERSVKHGSILVRYARKDVLTLRYDLLKANAVYGSYQLGSLFWHLRRHDGIHETLVSTAATLDRPLGRAAQDSASRSLQSAH